MNIEETKVEGDSIQLDQFLKWIGAVASGGAVKPLLLDGQILRNGQVETARRRRLAEGDTVELKGVGAWRIHYTERT